MSAWYMDMWVNAPLPVTSPSAHTPSAARIHPSVGITRAVSSSPTAATPSAASPIRRPVAISSRSAFCVVPATCTVKRVPSWLTCSAGALVRTVMPSAVKIRSISSLDSGSSNDSSRGSASITVTSVPKRAKTWANSEPMAPPPKTMSDRGTCSA